jgi:hypothetical protein
VLCPVALFDLSQHAAASDDLAEAQLLSRLGVEVVVVTERLPLSEQFVCDAGSALEQSTRLGRLPHFDTEQILRFVERTLQVFRPRLVVHEPGKWVELDTAGFQRRRHEPERTGVRLAIDVNGDMVTAALCFEKHAVYGQRVGDAATLRRDGDVDVGTVVVLVLQPLVHGDERVEDVDVGRERAEKLNLELGTVRTLVLGREVEHFVAETQVKGLLRSQVLGAPAANRLLRQHALFVRPLHDRADKRVVLGGCPLELVLDLGRIALRLEQRLGEDERGVRLHDEPVGDRTNHVGEVCQLAKDVHVDRVTFALNSPKQSTDAEDVFGDAAARVDEQQQRVFVVFVLGQELQNFLLEVEDRGDVPCENQGSAGCFTVVHDVCLSGLCLRTQADGQ